MARVVIATARPAAAGALSVLTLKRIIFATARL
nr:MAG TPA: hypothetical protein [Caudoviricetes sp.]